MNKGDLVRVWSHEAIGERSGEWGYHSVGLVLEYHSWEKIATVLMQSSGEIKRIAAGDLELLKRSPENIRRLCNLYRERIDKKN